MRSEERTITNKDTSLFAVTNKRYIINVEKTRILTGNKNNLQCNVRKVIEIEKRTHNLNKCNDTG